MALLKLEPHERTRGKDIVETMGNPFERTHLCNMCSLDHRSIYR